MSDFLVLSSMQKSEWHRYPFVSAILVTTERSRHTLAEGVIRDFLNQVWPVKEMVVVNSTGIEFPVLQSVRQFSIRYQPLGTLRNLARSLANGERLVEFDDDSEYDPNFIKEHMLRSQPGAVTVLSPIQAKVIPSGETVELNENYVSLSYSRSLRASYGENGDRQSFVQSARDAVRFSKPGIVVKYCYASH